MSQQLLPDDRLAQPRGVADAPPAPGPAGGPAARTSRAHGTTTARRRHAAVVTLALAIASFAAAAWHIAVGGSPIPLADVAATLLGMAPDARTELAVVEFRAPRTVAAVLAGSALGTAGALTQTVARNPLASPDVLGITNGAAFGAVGVSVLAGGSGGVSGAAAAFGMPAAAAVTGFVAAALVFLLAWKGGLESNRVIIVGLGVGGLAAALTTWMLTLGNVQDAAKALTWMSGTINGRDWGQIAPLWPVVLVGIAAALASRRGLNMIALNPDTAVALGLRINATRVWTLSLATLLAVAATVLAGPVAFVALASPQIARLITRGTIPPVPAAALVGALFLLLADLLAARTFEVALPAGVATAVIGAPYLMYLVIRQQRRHTA
ncbi:FecCD family ABC transporter permease [Zhihengliuella salsuginis]|uniref:Iron ABC transporter n=1 Tax=Zhihengliuella salsuginis TaxID=578222 RepID=A0ABQ3GBE8_9MICC|nr:iron ABC transporter permease [Zhihengliuella salsuginis]GHD00290.1 iron ABC transporter [Zhihengliuella salsuginis]